MVGLNGILGTLKPSDLPTATGLAESGTTTLPRRPFVIGNKTTCSKALGFENSWILIDPLFGDPAR